MNDASFSRNKAELECANFGKTTEAYYSRIYTFIFGMVRDRELARDLTQDTFLQAYRNLLNRSQTTDERSDTRDNMTGWLYRIAYNRVCSEMRHRKVIKFLPLFVRHPSMPDNDDEGFTTYETGVNFEGQVALSQEIQQAIELIGRKKLTAFLLYLDGFSYLEVAEITGEPLSTVKTKIHRAKQQLRKVLEPAQPVQQTANLVASVSLAS